jgi:hypothetical protein
MLTMQQNEILSRGPLLDEQGCLTQAGWSRQPMLDCNLERANFYRSKFFQPLRIKQWDYYGLFTPSHFFSFTIANIGYIGMIFAYVIEFESGHYCEHSIITPFGSGVKLPRNSTSGESCFANKKLEMAFRIEGGERHLKVDWPSFGEAGLSADVRLAQPEDHQSMTIVIPIEEKRFYYNRKINCMPADGWVSYRGEKHILTPDQVLGGLDWGRGVWALNSHWVWASSSGFLADGRRVGLNMGYGFGDNSAATENAFIVDRVMHKFGEVQFEFDSQDYMRPWTMKSPDGRVDLEFSPFFDRPAVTDAVLIKSEVHQMFGRYHGKVRTDHGEVIEIRNLIGFAEEHFARW